jgi:hypothetical protein
MNIAKFLMLLAVMLPAVAIGAAAEPLLEQLRLDHAAWATADRDFRARRESGALVGAEASDYAAYVARLQRRVAEDCAALSDAGVPAPEEMSCPRFETAVTTRSAAIDQGAEQSREERIASLDVELASGLADFDELLLREQERVKSAAPRSASAGGMGGGTDEDGHGGDGGDGNGDGKNSAGDTGTGGASTDDGVWSQGGGGAERSSTGAGGTQARTSRTGATRQPPGIPDGGDDDVVARQLREAAEKETDPELQKKLWDEYRKYKQGTR